MFDDQLPQGSGQAPPNLPIAEPEDIFSQTEEVGAPLETGAPVDEAPSALEAGILRPAVSEKPDIGPRMPEPVRVVEPQTPAYQMPEPGQETYALKEPMLSRGIMTAIISVIVLLILGGGGWWIWSFIRGKEAVPAAPIAQPLPSPSGQVDTQPTPVPTPATPSPTNGSGVPAERIDEQILFGEPLDRDGDGLDDTREEDLQLDPQNWDTDGDGLSDGDEVIIWKSNPLNSDTDQDNYPDGAEVKAGYSPTGPGRIFEPPTTTP